MAFSNATEVRRRAVELRVFGLDLVANLLGRQGLLRGPANCSDGIRVGHSMPRRNNGIVGFPDFLGS